MSRIIIALVLCFLLPSGGLAQKRVALVIGNSAYQSTPALVNPRNDATDMAIALRKLGFLVLDGFDLDKSSFDKKVRDFADALSDSKVGVFFYAGHGLQVAGTNYLVPVDAKLTSASALDWEMVRLDLVQRTMERETETNVLFLDACRDNPLARNLARAMGTRSGDIGRGLAATEAGVGTLISFSTQPGNVALDGLGRNSPFSGALAKRVSTSNDDLSALLIDVRNDVRKETQNKQVPWEHSALTGRFYFNAWAATPSPPAAPKESEASREWERVDKASVAELETFVRRHRSSAEAEYARARIQSLTQQAAVAPPTDRTPASSIERGLVGHWTLDSTDIRWTSATVGVAYDASGKNNTGTLVGMNRATSAIIGKVGDALKFNGSSNYIMNLSPNLPRTNAPITISAWLNVGTISDPRSAVVLNDSPLGAAASSALQLCIRNSTFLVSAAGGGTVIDSRFSPNLNTWYLVTFTFDGETNRIYVNGAEKTNNRTPHQSGASSSFWIGTYNGAHELWAGSIDDVRVYDRGLSANEVGQLFRMAASR